MSEHIPKDDRTRILEAARILVAQGHTKFSISAVCAQAGVARPLFRTCFSGRSELMAALEAGKDASCDVERAADTAVNAAPAAAPAQAVAAAPDAWLERRLRVFERALTGLEARAEAAQREHAMTIARLEERIRILMGQAAAAEAAREEEETVLEEQALRVGNGGTVTVRAMAPPDLEAAISAAPVAEPDIPAAEAQSAGTVTRTAAGEARERQAALMLPVESAREKAVPREEMAELLKGARQAARATVVEERPRRPCFKLRLHWLALGCLSLVVLFVCVGLTLGEPAGAVQMRSGNGVSYRHIPHDAFARMVVLADNGDARAQAGLALAYLRGEKVESDPRTAMRWAGQAAKAGDPVGQYLMGALYHQGEGVKPDAAVALRWFAAAARRGNIKAMHNLAIAYAEGLGTKKDAAKAAHWFANAAAHGYVDSAFDLAVLYERGDGVPQDAVQALKWYQIAAAAGDRPSQERAGMLRHQMNGDQIAQAGDAVRQFQRLVPLAAANNLPVF
jgi:TPR repeat protein